MPKLFQKLAVLFLLVAIVQISTGFQHCPPELRSVMKSNNCENNIVYLGDSTTYSCSVDDSDKRSIPTCLQDAINERVVGITHGAYHLGVYEDFVKYLIEHRRPKAIIVPINMRSFSAEWDTRPEYQFKKESLLLKLGIIFAPFYKPFSIYTDYFNDFANKDTWLDSNVYDNDTLAGKVKDFEKIGGKDINDLDMKKKIVFLYRYHLMVGHRKLKALNEICLLAKRSNAKILFYVTPVDFAYIDGVYAGTGDLVDKNVGVVKNIISNNGLPVLDLSHSIPSEFFDWKVNGFPNEHMNQKGRTFVANALSKELVAMGLDESKGHSK